MPIKHYPQTVKVVITVPANQPQNSILAGENVKIIVDPSVGPISEYTLGINESWVIKDIYVTKSPSIDVDLMIILDRTKIDAWTGPISTRLVSNPSRPKWKPRVIPPTTHLSFKAINLQPGGASDTTIEVYLDVEVFKKE